MSNTSTEWVLKLVDEVTAPARDIQAEVEGVREAFKDVLETVGATDEEMQTMANKAIDAYESLKSSIEAEEEKLKDLKTALEEVGDAIDPIKKAEIDLEVGKAESNLKRYRDGLDEIEATLNSSKNTAIDAAGGFLELLKSMDSFDFKGFNGGLGGIINQIKGMTNAAMRFIATPLGAAIGGLAAIVGVTKAFADYNKEAMQFNFVTEQITGLQGRAVDDARVRAKVIEQVYGKDFKDTLSTAQNLVNHFDISMDEAMDHISEGLVRGGHANHSFMKSFGRYGQLFNDAGYNVNEFRRIVNTGIDMGIYENKLPEAIKMFNKNIKEQSGATQKAMENALGKKFTDKLFSQVRDGSITPKAALASIADEAERIGVNIQQAQELSSKLFGSAGQDAGGFENIIKAINTALNKEEEALNGASAAMARAEKRALKLAEAKDKALNSAEMKRTLEEWDIFWNKMGIGFFNFVDSWTKGFRIVREGIHKFLVWSSVISTGGSMKEAADAWRGVAKEYADEKQAFDDEFVNENLKPEMDSTNKAWEKLVKKQERLLTGLSKNALENMLKGEEEKPLASRNTPLIEAINRIINPKIATTETSTSTKTKTSTDLQNDFGISGISGSGGGKVITMNLDIKNYFEVAKDAAADIEAIADKIFGRVNDRLRDALITLN
jgi:hypothetical protein